MRKKSLSLQRSAVLLTAVLLALSAGACGAEAAPSGQEADSGESAGTQSESKEPQNTASTGDSTDGEIESDTNSDTAVTSDIPNAEEQKTPVSPVTVTFQRTLDETKADDGKIIHTNSAQLPVVSIEGAAEIAEMINADLAAYYDTFTAGEAISLAKEDYAASLGEDGWDFLGYSSDISAKVTRADDAVISFELTSYEYTGGAHGNGGIVGRNYSAKTGELLAFDDISEDYEAFHATVLDYMINLAETPAYKAKLFGSPSGNDLDSVLFTPDSWVFTLSGISFLSNPYALGPHSSGTIHFMLPYEKAYDLGLKADYRYNGDFVDERYYIDTYDPETGEHVVDGTPDCYFDLDADGTKEGLAFYGYYVDPATAEGKYAFYIDGKDYGDVIMDELQNIADNSYMETTYALYHADASNANTAAIAVLFTEFGEGEDANGDPVRSPRSFIFGYTKEKGLHYLYWTEGYVTLPPPPHINQRGLL